MVTVIPIKTLLAQLKAPTPKAKASGRLRTPVGATAANLPPPPTDVPQPPPPAPAPMFASGVKASLGDESRPSVALLDRRVRWLDSDLEQRCQAGTKPGMSWQKLAWLTFLCVLGGFGCERLLVCNGARWCRLTLQTVRRWTCPVVLASLSICGS